MVALVVVPPPVIIPLPPAPQRLMSSETYPVVADTWAAAIGPWTGQVNVVVTWMNETISTVALAKDAAVQAANAAALSALSASQSETNALAYRNAAQAAAAAAGSAAGLPALAGNAGKALVVNDNEQGVAFKSLTPPLALLHALTIAMR